jgi:hypothetical protein
MVSNLSDSKDKIKDDLGMSIRDFFSLVGIPKRDFYRITAYQIKKPRLIINLLRRMFILLQDPIIKDRVVLHLKDVWAQEMEERWHLSSYKEMIHREDYIK